MSFLKEIRFDWSEVKAKNRYPFNISYLRNTNSINAEHFLLKRDFLSDQERYLSKILK